MNLWSSKLRTNACSHLQHGWEKPVFLKKQVFVLFSRKRQKPHSELFLLHHAISPFSELHSNNLLCLLWRSKLRVKKCTPSLFLQSVVGWFTQKVVRLGEHAHSKQKKTIPTWTQQFHVKFVHVLLVQHFRSVFFQHVVWYIVQQQKEVGCREGRKLVKIYRFHRTEEDDQ